MTVSSEQNKEHQPVALSEPARSILLIDDTPAIHDDIRKIFTQLEAVSTLSKLDSELFGDGDINHADSIDYRIDSAYQGLEGYRKVRQALDKETPYSLAIVDMRMPPGWDGLKTIEEIWEIDNEIQIIICTAYSDYNWTDISKRLGINDRFLILKKPFDNIEIIQMVNATTEKWVLSRKVKNQLQTMDSLVEKRTHELRVANKTLAYQATHDSLTGLSNRQELERCLTLAVNSPQEEVVDYCLCYLDLDQFKIVNDTSGHFAGDELLKSVADIFRKNVRQQDVAARVGGDEFVLLLESCPEQVALRIAQSILKDIKDSAFSWDGNVFDIGISIGIRSFTNNKCDIVELLKAADTACYKAKANGRNQAVLASDLTTV